MNAITRRLTPRARRLADWLGVRLDSTLDHPAWSLSVLETLAERLARLDDAKPSAESPSTAQQDACRSGAGGREEGGA